MTHHVTSPTNDLVELHFINIRVDLDPQGQMIRKLVREFTPSHALRKKLFDVFIIDEEIYRASCMVNLFAYIG